MTLTPNTLCSLCRCRVAELVVEHERERDDEPLCIAGGCADLWLERRGLELAEPEIARRLVPLEELVRT